MEGREGTNGGEEMEGTNEGEGMEGTRGEEGIERTNGVQNAYIHVHLPAVQLKYY